MRSALLCFALTVACTRRAATGPGEALGNEDEVARLVTAGDVAFSRREDPQQLAIALALWGDAAGLAPTLPGLRERLARGSWFAGFATEGEAAAVRWVEAEAWASDCPPVELACRYWGARAASDRAWEGSVSLGLRTGTAVEPLMREVEQSLATLDGAGATRWRAGWLARVPRFAGGDLEAAREAYDLAIAAAPDHLLTQLERAQYLATARGDENAFVSDLTGIEVAPPSETWEPENAITRARAAALLARRAALFPLHQERP